MQNILVGTRGSDLALWQANHVAESLRNLHPEVRIEVVPVKTEGDRRLDVTLSQIGGKGLFIKELERSLHEEKVDIAVHSMKDVTVHLDPELCIDVILDRGNPYDALVSNRYGSIDQLPANATIGTCSVRRKSQLQGIRPDLQFLTLRGNVTTRLNRLDAGEFDAIILAVSGLKRLGLEYRVAQILDGTDHVPSPGQGALGIECRRSDIRIQELIAPLNHEYSSIAVQAERLTNRELGGSCVAPIGIHASADNERIRLSAFVGSVDGSTRIQSSIEGATDDAKAVAHTLAGDLDRQGAQEILNAWKTD
ncbi:MAG: hydroxymethylbilane synthase [Acidiferrobacterales bacterium]|nr:hydroxymethylbilane synthase [Acidiferrobacterales bacterium]